LLTEETKEHIDEINIWLLIFFLSLQDAYHGGSPRKVRIHFFTRSLQIFEVTVSELLYCHSDVFNIHLSQGYVVMDL
jgi:hypothetical protein